MKVKKSILLLISAMVLSIGLVGCSSEEPNVTEGTSTVQESTQGETTEEKEETSKTDGQLGDYVVKIKGSERFTDWEGNDALKVTLDFTNNSEETTSFYVAMNAKGFQDGVEVDRVFDIEKLGENDMKEIKPGATIEVNVAFKIVNPESPMDVEIEEFVSFNGDKVIETINLQ